MNLPLRIFPYREPDDTRRSRRTIKIVTDVSNVA